ncbi:MAG: primosomal protein N' [Rhodospirillales bacterium]|nr:primosomal protein N' [Rhodospirillales bacterium]MCW8862293.1 primosomal protein N' [Rhodospirillales bacterium]
MPSEHDTPEPVADTGLGRAQPHARVRVLLPLPLPTAYDYAVPEGMALSPGDFVSVPFGRRDLIGVVWDETGAGDRAAPDSRLKSVLSRLDVPPLPRQSRQFVEWVADYTLAPRGAVLKMSMSVPAALEPPSVATAYARPTALPPDIRLTPSRTKVLDVLAAAPSLPRSELAREAGVGPAVIDGMVKAGGLVPVQIPDVMKPAAPDLSLAGPVLSAEQGGAASDLRQKVIAARFTATLLDGVPGSGKTEVYFEAVAEALSHGGNVLVLLPEIALSAQWLARFETRFGVAPVVWHSDLGQARRRAVWRAVAEGRAPVVVGARSALFLPHHDLGLIVVDEEHDASFKQEEGVVYNARDMAVVRAHIGEIPVVLATATPSLETVVNVETGKYSRLHLPERHAGATMPTVQAIDMRSDPPPRGSWLSEPLRKAIEETLTAGEQGMLYLNRRGYAPLTLCRKCGHRLQCPRCTAWLVEHRATARLQCHHCGYNVRLPERCPSCEAEDSLTACGPGVERLAEEVASLFPAARTVLAASDTMTGPRAAAELVTMIENHETDLIIGTQIVAKGYHFPKLTLVGVIDADLGLAGGDLRAAERTYQMLYQVSGRAGRGEHPGRVLLQTYMPEHPVMKALVAEDRDGLLAAERKAREAAGMPPFGRLVALIVSGSDEVSVDEAARELGRKAPRGAGISVLGPAPAQMAILRGRHRRRLLLKADRTVPVQAVVSEWLLRADVQRNIRVQVDVDPYSFF